MQNRSVGIIVSDFEAVWKSWYDYRNTISSVNLQLHLAQSTGDLTGLVKAIHRLNIVHNQFEQMRAKLKFFDPTLASLQTYQDIAAMIEADDEPAETSC